MAFKMIKAAFKMIKQFTMMELYKLEVCKLTAMVHIRAHKISKIVTLVSPTSLYIEVLQCIYHNSGYLNNHVSDEFFNAGDPMGNATNGLAVFVIVTKIDITLSRVTLVAH